MNTEYFKDTSSEILDRVDGKIVALKIKTSNATTTNVWGINNGKRIYLLWHPKLYK